MMDGWMDDIEWGMRQHQAKYERIHQDILSELCRASVWGEFNSAHEAYAHILEEMDELKEHVWVKQKNRDLEAMRQEAIQVATMAIKMVKLIDDGKGRV